MRKKVIKRSKVTALAQINNTNSYIMLPKLSMTPKKSNLMSKQSRVQFNSIHNSTEKLDIGNNNEANVYGGDQVNKQRTLGSSASERRNILTLTNQADNNAYRDSVAY